MGVEAIRCLLPASYHLGQESNRQMTMEDTDGGLHPAVDGQSLDEDEACVNVDMLCCTEQYKC